nr:zinc finger, CCHC-type [Tanacetum cinerariifolium]
MSDSLFDVYINVESAKELWDSLESKYMVADSSSKKFLVSNFTNYKMVDSRPVMEQYNELLRIIGQYIQHRLKMNESIFVSSIIDKLHPFWKDFKHTLKHGKYDLSLVQLGSHLRIEESLRAQDSDKGKGIAVVVKRTTKMLVVRDKGLRTNSKTKIDSGTTTHVCKDRCWFKTFEPVKDGSVLYMGDEHFASVHGKGSVALEFSSRKTITLFHVLYVPKLCKNLVSGPMLNKCGYKQVYESDKYILSKSDSAYMSSSTVVNSLLRHARLGHVHYKRMLEMSKDDLILAIDENQEKCTTCMLTKITRKPFQSITRKSVILELIHSNLCDFHAIPSLGNKKYVITFIDDAFRFCYVYVKDKALDKFRIYKTEVELQQNDLVKTLRTDRGGEYYDPVFFQSVGIIHEITTPYTPQQNDVAERKNKALKEMVNSMLSYSGLSEGLWEKPCYKWIFKKKMKFDGTVDKFKARLVIQGFRQKERIDYFDTYAPVARITTIRLLLALAAIHNLVCNLVKSLYGLKQAPKQWHQKFDEVVLSSGIHQNQSDKCVYSKFDDSGKGVINCLYVDDMLIFGTDQNQVDKTKKFLSSRFLVKDMGEANVILGIKIKRENKGIVITQSHYIEKILKKFNHEDCSPVSTLMDPVEKLKPNTGKPVDQLEYSRAIGCVMYAMTSTRPDIAYDVGRLSRFTSNPSRHHWKAITRVFKYLRDSSSMSGWVFLLGRGAISWASKKQTCITGSTMESEFVALATADSSSMSGWVFLLGRGAISWASKKQTCITEAEWLRNLIHEIPICPKPIAPISIRCDSAPTMARAYSQIYNGKSRHLGVRHSMVRELIRNGVISIEFVRTQHNLADHLTKGLVRDLVYKEGGFVGDFSVINGHLGNDDLLETNEISYSAWIRVSKSNADKDVYLLPEFDDLMKEFDITSIKANLNLSEAESRVIKETREQEISNLQNTVKRLKEHEHGLKALLLEYSRLKEQETKVRELQSHLEAARAKIKLLKKKLISKTTQNKERILGLQQRVQKMQEDERKGSVGISSEIESNLCKLKDLEVEDEELRKSNNILTVENAKLLEKLQRVHMLDTSVLEDDTTRKLREESKRLKKQNKELKNEIEQLQADRRSGVEELVYLKWINTCLRYELRNHQPDIGKIIARDLSKTLSLKSEARAKQLILEYTNKEYEGKMGVDIDINIPELDSDKWSSSQNSNLADSGEIDEPYKKNNKFFRKLVKFLRGKDESTPQHHIHHRNHSHSRNSSSEDILSYSSKHSMYSQRVIRSLAYLSCLELRD